MAWINKIKGLDERLEKNFRELNKYYDKVIEDHVNSSNWIKERDDEDLVDVLLRIQKDPNRDVPLIKGLLAYQQAIFFMRLNLNDWFNRFSIDLVVKKVQQVAKGKNKVQESDLCKLEYLKLVIKETLRLHPPAPLLVRGVTICSCKIMEYEIPANTRVLINGTAIGNTRKIH
ncbi:hypothetical protein RND71_005800 [Anisodus tanguticus]|uniref:Cytochrome P450 n=1 Tax=Anisodus tanguticus TaxID=243964 RepID=A0AAE1ST62_9SOLA|nr:hypothetical protein RND71_005800 [Anisodus tanguticus]